MARPETFPAVLARAGRQISEEVFTTSICEAELLFGLVIMPAGWRRDALAWALIVTLTAILGGRVLPLDLSQPRPMRTCGTAQAGRHGRGLADLHTAAIAIARGAGAIANRNVAHFEGCGVPVVNP
jgi:toxin FitB